MIKSNKWLKYWNYNPHCPDCGLPGQFLNILTSSRATYICKCHFAIGYFRRESVTMIVGPVVIKLNTQLKVVEARTKDQNILPAFKHVDNGIRLMETIRKLLMVL